MRGRCQERCRFLRRDVQMREGDPSPPKWMCVESIFPFSPHLLKICCLLPSSPLTALRPSQWPPRCLRPAERDAVMWRWMICSVVVRHVPFKKKRMTPRSIYFVIPPAKVHVPTISLNELPANPAMKWCVRDLCKPKINVGCVNKKLVNWVEEACPPPCPLDAGWKGFIGVLLMGTVAI